jgi:glutamate racemase
MKIGFFDSGLGGLLVLKAVAKHLPQYDYEYYGDTANLPYGDKTEAEIYELTKVGVEHLFSRGCALVVLACNTASAETLRRLQDQWLPTTYPERRILGVIIPVIEEVIESGIQKALLIATRRTVSSGKYHLELGKRNVIDIKIEAVATPELVPLIEAGEIETALQFVIAMVDERKQGGGLEGLILGCTHYALLMPGLTEHYGDTLTIFSQTDIIPRKLAAYLDSHNEIKNALSQGGGRNVFVTKHSPVYDTFIEQLLEGKMV